MSLEKLNGGQQFQRDREQWKKVATRLRAGDMPPADYDAPDESERTALVEWVEAKLAEFNCEGPQDPGWVTLRRLNRDQYRNTIRDLLRVDYEPAETFPPDELAYGFDNNGDALSLTPALVEKYLAAASQIADEAILTPESLAEPAYDVPRDRWKGAHYNAKEAQQLNSEGVIDFVYNFLAPGRYLLRATVSGEQAGDEPVRMAMVDDGKIIKTVELHGQRDEAEVFVMQFETQQGSRRLGVAFTNDYYLENNPNPENHVDRNLIVRKLEVRRPD